MDYQKKVFFVRCKKGTNHIVDVNQIKVHLRENIKEMRDWEVNDFVNYLFQNKKNDVKCGEDTIIDYNVMDDGPLNPLTISDIIEIELENLFRENLINEIKKNKQEIQKNQIETNQNIEDPNLNKTQVAVPDSDQVPDSVSDSVSDSDSVTDQVPVSDSDSDSDSVPDSNLDNSGLYSDSDSDSDVDFKLSFEGERTVGTEVKDKVDDHFNKGPK